MAFPTTSVLDAFTRADGTLTDGIIWSADKVFAATGSNMLIASNLASCGNANWNSTAWLASQFGPDCEAYVTVPTLPAGATDEVAFVLARISAYGTTTPDGYGVAVTKSAGTDTIDIYRIDNGAQNVIGTRSQEFAAGDSVGIACVGSAIQAWYKSGAGAWTQLGASVTDSTYTGAGYVGFELYSTTVRADNFGGGTVVAGGGEIVPLRPIMGRGATW